MLQLELVKEQWTSEYVELVLFAATLLCRGLKVEATLFDSDGVEIGKVTLNACTNADAQFTVRFQVPNVFRVVILVPLSKFKAGAKEDFKGCFVAPDLCAVSIATVACSDRFLTYDDELDLVKLKQINPSITTLPCPGEYLISTGSAQDLLRKPLTLMNNATLGANQNIVTCRSSDNRLLGQILTLESIPCPLKVGGALNINSEFIVCPASVDDRSFHKALISTTPAVQAQDQFVIDHASTVSNTSVGESFFACTDTLLQVEDGSLDVVRKQIALSTEAFIANDVKEDRFLVSIGTGAVFSKPLPVTTTPVTFGDGDNNRFMYSDQPLIGSAQLKWAHLPVIPIDYPRLQVSALVSVDTTLVPGQLALIQFPSEVYDPENVWNGSTYNAAALNRVGHIRVFGNLVVQYENRVETQNWGDGLITPVEEVKFKAQIIMAEDGNSGPPSPKILIPVQRYVININPLSGSVNTYTQTVPFDYCIFKGLSPSTLELYVQNLDNQDSFTIAKSVSSINFQFWGTVS